MDLHNTTVIFLHGTMGSILRKNGIKIWPVAKQQPGHYLKNLTPIADNDGIEAYSTLVTYKLLRESLKLTGLKFIDYVYDWRKTI
jgi:hypothetical protein